MTGTTDLSALLRSSNPLISAESTDEARLMALLRSAARALGLPVWTWSAARGLSRDGHDAQYQTTDPRRALQFVGDLSDPGLFVFVDAHHALADPVTLRAAKDAAMAAGAGQTIVITAPHAFLPPELRGIAVTWTLDHPTQDELANLVNRTAEDLAERGLTVDLDASARTALVVSLTGLSLADAERILLESVLDGGLDGDDITTVRAAKVELLNTDGVLELIESESGTIDDVGGLDTLKDWLRIRGSTIGSQRASDMGIDPPRGVLLTGIPGTGKSMIAKSLAATWSRPLILLDPGRVYRKYVGESEQRLESALKTADAMAPAVLWIDEIEKGFAAGGDDGGVSTRLLGSFLRWMQDRPDGVFIVATANDVGAIPAELLRKGRFDEVFFVDLPAPSARESILIHHLRTRGHDVARLDIEKVVEITDGFSGAELEAVVVGALYRAFAAETGITTEELVAEVESTVPLSVARADSVSALRSWAAGRAVSA